MPDRKSDTKPSVFHPLPAHSNGCILQVHRHSAALTLQHHCDGIPPYPLRAQTFSLHLPMYRSDMCHWQMISDTVCPPGLSMLLSKIRFFRYSPVLYYPHVPAIPAKLSPKTSGFSHVLPPVSETHKTSVTFSESALPHRKTHSCSPRQESRQTHRLQHKTVAASIHGYDRQTPLHPCASMVPQTPARFPRKRVQFHSSPVWH